MAEKSDDEELDVEEETFIGTDITTSHYVPKTTRDVCQNKACGQSFVQPFNIRRPHHCKRCGEIFCRPCLQYKRRLNTMAQPDPNGVLCKVCLTCFEDRVVYLGCTKRSQTELFLLLRKQVKKEMTDIVYEYAIVTRGVSKHPAFWKEQSVTDEHYRGPYSYVVVIHRFKVDILKECLRLLRGFKSSVGNSETLKTVNEFKDYMNVPQWQKSTFWTLESHNTRCRQCSAKVGRRKKNRNCRVCGITLCKTCSLKDLLLYFEDSKKPSKEDTAKLAIIRYIGCPDTEPRLSMLLYCCSDCREDLINRQIEDQNWYLQKPKPPDLETEMIRMDDEFRPLIDDIKDDMEKLLLTSEDQAEVPEEVSEDDSISGLLESESQRANLAFKEQKIQTLKDSINEKLRTYWSMYSELTAVLKCSGGQLTRRNSDFVKNYFAAKKDFYAEVKAEMGKTSEKAEAENDLRES